MHSKLKLSHVNCRSLYKKLAQISCLFKDSDILCCTETWLSPVIIDPLLAISGKTIFRCNRSTRWGGVCIYVDINLSPFCKVDGQSSYIRPPKGNHSKCIDQLTEILSRREIFKKELWLLGDFNVDYLKRGDPSLKRFLNFFKLFGLTQYLSDIAHSGSCIDWIVTNCRFVKSSCVSNIFISDHYAIECLRKKARERSNTVRRDV